MRRRRWVLIFLATALAGLAVRQLYIPAEGRSIPWILFVFWQLPLTMLVAAVAGYVSPRGYWLWGIAAACLGPVEELLVFSLPLPSDLQEQANGSPDYSFEARTLLVLVVACTVSATAGARWRLLVRWLLGRSEAPLEGEEPGPSDWGEAARRFGLISWRAVIRGTVAAFLVDALLRFALFILLFFLMPEEALLWESRDPEAIPSATFIFSLLAGSALAGLGASLLGGYRAGRRAGRQGGLHGLMVAGGFLLLTISGIIFTDLSLAGASDPRLDPTVAGLFLVGLVISWLLRFLGGYLGGKRGERYASRAVQTH